MYKAPILALLLAVSIAVVTVFFLSVSASANRDVLIIAAASSFSASFLLAYLFFEFLIFKEVKKIDTLLEKFPSKETTSANGKEIASNPFHRISEGIHTIASGKQKEIDELRKTETFRKEFIADVSHELKTPIFAAQGFVHTLLDGAVNDKNVRTKFLKKAAKSLDGLDMLVQDLLTLSQIETGEIKMKFEHIDLYKLCEEVVEQFEERAEKKNVRLKLKADAQPILVFADWQRITQVVTNLVSNAINYTPEAGDVSIEFEVGKKRVATFISDTGEGIPPDHIHRIFERFYRVDKSRSREKGGTGLGLAIVKHILEGHSSKAEVESILGKGSVFSFKLVRSKQEEDI